MVSAVCRSNSEGIVLLLNNSQKKVPEARIKVHRAGNIFQANDFGQRNQSNGRNGGGCANSSILYIWRQKERTVIRCVKNWIRHLLGRKYGYEY